MPPQDAQRGLQRRRSQGHLVAPAHRRNAARLFNQVPRYSLCRFRRGQSFRRQSGPLFGDQYAVGQLRPARRMFEPRAWVERLTAKQMQRLGNHHLADDLRRRIATAPQRLHAYRSRSVYPAYSPQHRGMTKFSQG